MLAANRINVEKYTGQTDAARVVKVSKKLREESQSGSNFGRRSELTTGA